MELTDEELKEKIEEATKKAVQEAQLLQATHDRLCSDGNAFFAEALDHIAGLARTSDFWHGALNCGVYLKQEFEYNTGQKPRPTPKPESDAQPTE